MLLGCKFFEANNITYNKLVVTGTPGIGKTVFSAYYAACAGKTVVWEPLILPGADPVTYLMTTSSGVELLDTKSSTLSTLSRNPTQYTLLMDWVFKWYGGVPRHVLELATTAFKEHHGDEDKALKALVQGMNQAIHKVTPVESLDNFTWHGHCPKLSMKWWSDLHRNFELTFKTFSKLLPMVAITVDWYLRCTLKACCKKAEDFKSVNLVKEIHKLARALQSHFLKLGVKPSKLTKKLTYAPMCSGSRAVQIWHQLICCVDQQMFFKLLFPTHIQSSMRASTKP
ncbi:uncharacterized protein PGTG_22632 [Puccinia graminis f. sp. tritici CRL 75-36-700-3]|uniref:Uncharacterized protein n=1 Tax=Puccinia graminis f. sp. tritici (strain CRL 75-36-700-3 / race SCCL) TaxID=418459 RepID=H6QV24_PUCGT|nr:uncharacterized protein PGTG_22632 [Puccinia graminis f. sp. tritici CRL 75-36-700-3]EHS62637.1 hypothetical protein PGTG_22632 [Puccinia graminis f. sp. tritici CRL 75-36-700-3]